MIQMGVLTRKNQTYIRNILVGISSRDSDHENSHTQHEIFIDLSNMFLVTEMVDKNGV